MLLASNYASSRITTWRDPFSDTSDAGWQIVQANGKRETVAGSEEQRAAARETIGRRKLEDEYNRFLQEMRGDAYVDIRSGTTPAPTTTGG